MSHYNAYKQVFKNHKKQFLPINEWNYIILNDNIDNYLKREFGESSISSVKQEKLECLKNEKISFTKNSDVFLNFLIEHNFNFCVVTNTNKASVDIFKTQLPLLNGIKQWITRDDYNLPKPNRECYQLAKQTYYKNEKYIIGFEDSIVGYNALKYSTDLIYIYNNEIIFKNNDCYLFDDYSIFI
jgi:beta-phosphoglucomutase-like phosphatase (HAD superfamily)